MSHSNILFLKEFLKLSSVSCHILKHLLRAFQYVMHSISTSYFDVIKWINRPTASRLNEVYEFIHFDRKVKETLIGYFLLFPRISSRSKFASKHKHYSKNKPPTHCRNKYYFVYSTSEVSQYKLNYSTTNCLNMQIHSFVNSDKTFFLARLGIGRLYT